MSSQQTNDHFVLTQLPSDELGERCIRNGGTKIQYIYESQAQHAGIHATQA